MMFESPFIRLLLPGNSRRLRQVLTVVSSTVLFLELIEPVGLLQDPGVYQNHRIPEPVLAPPLSRELPASHSESAPVSPPDPTNVTPPPPADLSTEANLFPKVETQIVGERDSRGPIPPPVGPDSNLQLKGIVGWPNRPMALINNQAMAPGDAWVVEAADAARLKVRCLEILRDRVIITLEEQDGRSERCLLTFNDNFTRGD